MVLGPASIGSWPYSEHHHPHFLTVNWSGIQPPRFVGRESKDDKHQPCGRGLTRWLSSFRLRRKCLAPFGEVLGRQPPREAGRRPWTNQRSARPASGSWRIPAGRPSSRYPHRRGPRVGLTIPSRGPQLGWPGCRSVAARIAGLPSECEAVTADIAPRVEKRP